MTSLSRPSTERILHNILLREATRIPRQIYAMDDRGGSINYEESARRALCVAAWMRAKGVVPGDRVLSIMDPSIDAVLLFFSCALIGAIYVPMNVAYKGKLLRHVLTLIRPKVAFADNDYAQSISDEEQIVSIPLVLHSSGLEYMNQKANVFDWRKVLTEKPLDRKEVIPGNWDRIALLLLTSGTTGASKAVPISWLHFFYSSTRICQINSMEGKANFYSPWPLNHISGAMAPYAALLLCGQLTLRRRWSTSALIDDLSMHKCTSMILMGETVKYFEQMNGIEKTKLKYIFIAPVYDGIVQILEKHKIKYCTNYNSTETNSPIGSEGYEPVPFWSCGKAREDAELRLIDDDGNDVRLGEIGELLVRNRDDQAMSQRYWGMEEKSKERWANGWFHTGDLLRQDASGFFYVIGRKGDRIRTKGENISPDELEWLLREGKGVDVCCVVGDNRDGLDDRIWLFVKLKLGWTEDSMNEYCEKKLPKFMRPAEIRVIDKLPMTPTGKVQRAIMRARVLSGEFDEMR